jgi:hypothetical protein
VLAGERSGWLCCGQLQCEEPLDRESTARSGEPFWFCMRSLCFALQNGNLHVACIELVHCYFLLLLIQCTEWYATKELRKCHWLSRRGWNFNFYGMK